MPITLESLRRDHLPRLFAYWRTISAGIPYFFPTSREGWQACLLADRLDGESIFKRLETWLALDGDQVLGFAQVGQPNFSWNEQGERFSDPAIGVLRHLYFERETPAAGRALLAQTERFLGEFPRSYAFYHILGMSCNAHHGKLHQSMSHVESLLLESGFRIEHENVYYAFELGVERTANAFARSPLIDLLVDVERSGTPLNNPNQERYEARLPGVIGDSAVIGLATIRLLGSPSGGMPEYAYLTWIGLDEGWRGKGLGALFLQALIDCLAARGVRHLHTDTAGNNIAAQHFYERFGFQNLGKTRSYLRP